MPSPKAILQAAFGALHIPSELYSARAQAAIQEIERLGLATVVRDSDNVCNVTLTPVGAALLSGSPVATPEGLQNKDGTYRSGFWVSGMALALEAFSRHCEERRRANDPGYPFGAPSDDYWWQKFLEFCRSR